MDTKLQISKGKESEVAADEAGMEKDDGVGCGYCYGEEGKWRNDGKDVMKIQQGEQER